MSEPRSTPFRAQAGTLTSNTIVTEDGTSLYYKDWGSGPAVVFSHGYPLSSDAWEYQMMFLVQHGYRVIAHDRRGFGRSGQPGIGYDFDTFADDLALLVEALDLHDAAFVGHSMGGGEVARYISRHGASRVAKAAFIASVTPFILQTADNPHGAPIAVFDDMRRALTADRSQWTKDGSERGRGDPDETGGAGRCHSRRISRAPRCPDRRSLKMIKAWISEVNELSMLRRSAPSASRRVRLALCCHS